MSTQLEPGSEPVSINSCRPFPINYVPDPPRLWSREQYGCPPNTDQDPLFYEKLSERRKAEIFKYKNNVEVVHNLNEFEYKTWRANFPIQAMTGDKK